MNLWESVPLYRFGVSKASAILLLLLVLLVAGITFYVYQPGEVTTVTLVTTVSTSTGPTETMSKTSSPPRTLTVTMTGTETEKETKTRTETVTTTITTTVSSGASTGATQTKSPTTRTTTGSTTQATPEILTADLVSPSRIWFCPSKPGYPSRVLEYDFSKGQLKIIFDPASTSLVSSFTPHPGIKEKVYYANANTNKIILRLLGYDREMVAFEHSTRVRCVRFGPGDHLYFSEATGAGGNGKIYRIIKNEAELYLEIPLDGVGGYWAGDFEFAPDGTLYLSQGNVIPAKLFVYTNGRFEEVAKFPFPVMGIDYVTNARLRTQGGGGRSAERSPHLRSRKQHLLL